MTSVSKNKVCLKGTKISEFEDMQRKCDVTESCSTAGVPDVSISGSTIGLSA
jgi:hypothetical protein